MIIGSGDIASVLTEKQGRTYFASGVSNSQETRESEFTREISLLKKQSKHVRLVYFSSLSVFYSYSRYANHKKDMEKLVRELFPRYTIIRLGNITWGDNPHTIINYLRRQKANNEPFEIQDVYRYVVDKEEFLHWIDMVPTWNCDINIPGRRMKVQQIVDELI